VSTNSTATDTAAAGATSASATSASATSASATSASATSASAADTVHSNVGIGAKTASGVKKVRSRVPSVSTVHAKVCRACMWLVQTIVYYHLNVFLNTIVLYKGCT
jgi:hypothetical protein